VADLSTEEGTNMNGVQQAVVVDPGPTTALEEEGMARLFPWQCYSDGLRTFNEYRMLSEMCASVGVEEQQVLDAIKHNKGNLGSYHFVQR
jgi:hypothetical protein